MNALFVAVAFGTFMVVCQASTTMGPTTHAHHSHHTHDPNVTKEPTESEHMSFMYTHSHNMVIKKGHDCYVATLTADEQTAVHTDSGLRALEIKLLGLLDSATPTTKDALSNADQHACKQLTNFYTIP